MEQEENKHKTSSTGKLKDLIETNKTINWKIMTDNVDVQRGKYLSIKQPWKIYVNNKNYCSYQIFWSNKISPFCSICFYHVSYISILF